jgi:putative transcriptional regulator
LVAAPSLRCPFFNHTLVLLVDHGEEGSFGFVLNKPAEVQLASVLSELDLSADLAPHVPVMLGGPVSPQTGWVVFDRESIETTLEEVLDVEANVSLTASIKMLEAFAAGRGPERAVLLLGYAGWGPGQLEDEMRDGSWFPMDVDARLIFDVPPEERWDAALAQLGIEPGWVMGTSAPSA